MKAQKIFGRIGWDEEVDEVDLSKKEINYRKIGIISAVHLMRFFLFSSYHLVEKKILSNLYSCAFYAKMLSFRVIGVQTLLNTCI